MKAKELREKFINFFEKENHKKVASSSLIPHNDPTLLFANAGMNQFKDYFTGKEKPKSKRAVTVQKCVRAGGKHNDLDNVGLTARHHTFFEMLGNFSFGDYFKEEAINFAWTFLTQELKIPREKLYITVHETDDEAKSIWMKNHNISEDRIFKMGDKDNFWEMGDIGPCGPCSEIFYDHGPEFSSGDFSHPMEDEMRCVEIWNLVFMQYEKHIGKERTNLPKPSVDTGAGLERLAAVVQGVYWNYDTDLFTPIFKKIEEISSQKYADKRFTTNMRVVADHIRSSSMLITDGVIPSNEGRGYVLRRIIRRAIRHLNELGVQEVSFYKIVRSCFEVLGEEYKGNFNNIELAEMTLKREEESFRKTLNNGLKILDSFILETKGKELSGEHAFKLYDTYGFPVDLTETLLAEKSMTLDHKSFQVHMKKQVEMSRSSNKFSSINNEDIDFSSIKEKFGETVFQGYETLESQSKLLDFKDLGDGNAILFFDKTPFYGESGGQAGDKGIVANNGNEFQVFDTQKPLENFYAHYVKGNINNLEKSKIYDLKVNKNNRKKIIAHHSATHLLQAALIKVLGSHVKQSGSLVNEEKLRFDFTHDKSLSLEEILEVERNVNFWISEAPNTQAQIMDKDQAFEKGAMALFGEKYGDKVRVISMGEFSTELCGGVHVDNISQIKIFKITSESSLSTGIRRIEALASDVALDWLSKRSSTLSLLEKSLGVKGEDVLSKIENQTKEIKVSNKEIEKLKNQIMSMSSKNMFENFEDLGKFKIYITQAPSDTKDLRKIADLFTDKNQKDVLFLYKKENEKTSFILKTDKKNKEIHLSNSSKSIITELGGRGGGKPFMVQGNLPSETTEKFIEKIKIELGS